MFTFLTDPLLSLIYPQSCVTCGFSVEEHRNGVSCNDCWSQTHIFTGSETLCAKCGAFIQDKLNAKPTFCGDCGSQSFDSAHAVGIYEKALAAAILRLKKDPHIPATLQEHLAMGLNRIKLAKGTVIVPVPLSAKRRLERGFNQAESIAECIAKETGFRVEKACWNARCIQRFTVSQWIKKPAKCPSLRHSNWLNRIRSSDGTFCLSMTFLRREQRYRRVQRS
jgi:Predicted amidophosphoribosyltransferases